MYIATLLMFTPQQIEDAAPSLDSANTVDDAKVQKTIALRFRICLHSGSESDIQTQPQIAFISEERIYVNMNNGIDEIKKINEIEETAKETDPFDEALEDNVIIGMNIK